jgi:glycosyltransferase involved in cell wall biosynthesis
MFGGCTIIAANYLPFARVLAASFRRTHPGAPFWVLVVDDQAARWVIEDDEDFQVLGLADIAIPDEAASELAAIYDVMELSTAVKPWLLQHLVATTDRPVLYLDPDIEVFGPLDQLAEKAERHAIVVTPHLLEPLPLDGLFPDDAHILRSGVHNLGFLAVGPSSLDGGFFEFWQSRVWRHAVVDVAVQLFTDQRWLDWIDCFDHIVERDPGCNVAYWNVWSRRITRDGDRFLAGGHPLRFFHFSGFDPSTPSLLSKHQGRRPRVLLSDEPDLAELCRRYAAAVIAAGHGRHRPPYGWARSGGVELTPVVRRLYRKELMEAELRGGPLPPNPFAECERFVAWIAEPAAGGCPLPRLLLAEHDRRPDLQAAFPDPLGASGPALLAWAQSDDDFAAAVPAPVLGVLSDAVVAPDDPLPGVNVAGYLTSELGVGAVGRLVVEAAEAAGVPVAVESHGTPLSRMQHDTASVGDGDWRYDVNVICANADAVAGIVGALGPERMADRSTVAIWHWEAERLPESMRSAWDVVDEVWATSQFTLDALAADASKPLRLFPLPVPVVDRPSALTRADLELPDGFLVLFCFDWLSVVERKNPLALIDAYCQAFSPADGAHLVLKSINGDLHAAALERLRLATDRPDVDVMDGYLSWWETRALMELADCYASLHRSEGFGLTMAEAMALGKPVVATGWSGNLDFMDDRVACLVPADLVPVPPDVPVYGGIGRWADPDIDAAARALRWVHDEPTAAAALGARARDHLVATRSPVQAGRFLAEQCERLRSALA